MHNCSGSQARVAFTFAATVDRGPTRESVGWPSIAFVLLTVVADETIGEALGVEVGNAGFLGRELLLEFG
jgi:hypothetical protein